VEVRLVPMSSDQPVRPDLAALLALSPQHALPSDGSVRVQRLTGRPKKVDPRPTVSQLEYNDQLNEMRDSWVEHDDLFELLARRQRADASEVVQLVRVRIAQECAALSWDARQADAKGRDSEGIRQRRIDGLLKLASLEVTRIKLKVDSFDPRSPKVKMVVESLLQAVVQVAAETLPEAASKDFVEKLTAAMVGWEDAVADLT
jgi:hypothetical protein